jgi:hypothetical protein
MSRRCQVPTLQFRSKLRSSICENFFSEGEKAMKVVGMKILEVMGTLQFRSSISEIFLLSHKITTNLTCLNTGQRYGMLYEQLQKLTFIWLKQLWIVLASLSSLKTYPLAMMKEVKF